MLDDDGLPLDEVGEWAKEKHERLRRYIDISRATRRKFVQGPGGATYIDLFCGTGRAIIRETGEKKDGSPMVAFKCARDSGVLFSQLHISDVSEDSCRAAEKRIIDAGGSPITEVGQAENTAALIVRKLNPYGLHFAFLDPYNLQDLSFSVIEALSRLKHIDMLNSCQCAGLAAQPAQLHEANRYSTGKIRTRLEKRGRPETVTTGNPCGHPCSLGQEN